MKDEEWMAKHTSLQISWPAAGRRVTAQEHQESGLVRLPEEGEQYNAPESHRLLVQNTLQEGGMEKTTTGFRLGKNAVSKQETRL